MGPMPRGPLILCMAPKLGWPGWGGKTTPREDRRRENLSYVAVNAPVTPCGLVGSMLGSMGWGPGPPPGGWWENSTKTDEKGSSIWTWRDVLEAWMQLIPDWPSLWGGLLGLQQTEVTWRTVTKNIVAPCDFAQWTYINLKVNLWECWKQDKALSCDECQSMKHQHWEPVFPYECTDRNKKIKK